jgi:hypothetical protein
MDLISKKWTSEDANHLNSGICKYVEDYKKRIPSRRRASLEAPRGFLRVYLQLD